MSNPPLRQCAAALIRNENGEVLMVRQAYGKQMWGLPGGVVEPGETPLQAAVRETAEEVGVGAELTDVVGAYLLQGGGWPDIQAYVFTARIVSGEPRPVNPQEIAALGWFALDEVPDPLPNDVRAAFEDVRAGRTGQVRTVQRTLNMAAVPLE